MNKNTFYSYIKIAPIVIILGLVLLLIRQNISWPHDDAEEIEAFTKYIAEQNKQKQDDLYLMYWPSKQLYKIGRSIHPQKRQAEINRDIFGSSYGDIELLKVLGGKGKDERRYHKMFKEHRIYIDHLDGSCGTEWFTLTKSQVDSVR